MSARQDKRVMENVSTFLPLEIPLVPSHRALFPSTYRRSAPTRAVGTTCSRRYGSKYFPSHCAPQLQIGHILVSIGQIDSPLLYVGASCMKGLHRTAIIASYDDDDDGSKRKWLCFSCYCPTEYTAKAKNRAFLLFFEPLLGLVKNTSNVTVGLCIRASS